MNTIFPLHDWTKWPEDYRGESLKRNENVLFFEQTAPGDRSPVPVQKRRIVFFADKLGTSLSPSLLQEVLNPENCSL
jgi:hypothetical protein